MRIEPAHKLLVLNTASNGGSYEPVLMRSLIRAFAARTCAVGTLSRLLIPEDNLACVF